MSSVDEEGKNTVRQTPEAHARASGLRARQLARLQAQARQIDDGRPLATCGDRPPAGLLRGIDQFNQREYFECHETLEQTWNEESGPVRVLYKGILQVGVGCYHLLRGNYQGAAIKLHTGANYLEAFAPHCMTVDVVRLISEARALRAAVVAAGPERLHEVDLTMLPVIQLVAQPPEV